MNLGFDFRSGRLGDLRDVLEGLVARVNTVWKKEHTGDGAHGDVHASSVSSVVFTAPPARINVSDVKGVGINPSTQRVNNWDPAQATHWEISGGQLTSPITLLQLTGMARGAPGEIRIVTIGRSLLDLGGTIDLLFEHADSLAPNRFASLGGVGNIQTGIRFRQSTLTTLARHSFVAIWDGTIARWVVVAQTGGMWIGTQAFDAITASSLVVTGNASLGVIYERSRSTPMLEWVSRPFSAANFTGSGFTWTVANAVTDRYALGGLTMHWSLDVRATSVSGTPTNALLVTIPGGLSGPTVQTFPTARVLDNGAFVNAFVSTLGGTQVAITRQDGAAWSVTAGGTQIRFSISFEVS